jgi:RsiW-degrading membrane proteinase PrsW (M82 family)
MDRFFRIVVWFAAAFAGLFVWNAAPDFRPLINWLLVGIFLSYVLSIIVGMTVRRVISVEQLELRSRLDLLDRKVTALLKNGLEQRRLR